MSLRKTSLGVPLHRQISSVLEDAIATGRHQPGERLPTEDTMCATYGVSRITVRRAMQSLEEAGLIERRQGEGTFVAHSPAVAALQTSLASFMQRVAEKREQTTVQVRECLWLPAPAPVAESLNLAPGAQVMKVVRLRLQGELPYTLSTLYLPPDVGGQLTCGDFATTPLSSLLQRLDRGYGRIEVSSGAVLADPVLADLLQVKVGDPLVDVQRLAFDGAGQPVEYQTVLAPAARYRLHATIGT